MQNFLDRKKFLNSLESIDFWDVIVIGGGATGLGIALDSASRGYKTILFEKSDFSQGTSSRSTKLVHGGIRYLSQGNIRLVYEALKERGLLLKNAPHLVKKQKFIIPIFSWHIGVFYWIGLKLYEWLSGPLSFGNSQFLSRTETMFHLPEINSKKLKGGILYYDGQFDDSRLAINLAQTCVKYGGIILNYFKVNKLNKNGNKISGVQVCDLETKKEYSVLSNTVINATGIFSESISKMDSINNKLFIKPSQGTHIVLKKDFFSGKYAMVIPKTSDGRLLFCIPWYDHVLIGTTDTPLNNKIDINNPLPLSEEINFLLDTFRKYFVTYPKKCDILSSFSGLRPLFSYKHYSSLSSNNETKNISRSHKIIINPSGLINVIGGKWTTYRKMAEDTINKAIEIGKLQKKDSITKKIQIHGTNENINYKNSYWNKYGEDEYNIKKLVDKYPELKSSLFANKSSLFYSKAEVVWMIRNEMARTVEDILARRFRILFLDAKKSIEIAPQVASLMAKELKKDKNWETEQVHAFNKLAAKCYYPNKK